MVLRANWNSGFENSCGRTQSGTFKDGNLLVNKDGVQIVPQSEVEAVICFSSPSVS